MDIDHVDADHLAQTSSLEPDSLGHARHLECEILSWVPLLRAVARVRSLDVGESSALVTATLQRALAEPDGHRSTSDLRPWLLGLQRAIYATRRPEPEVVAPGLPAASLPARGASATWRQLHLALLRLPDRQREALMLADGAYCRPDELAPILDCRPAEARRLVRHARAGLLARLAAAHPLSFPPSRPPLPHRPVAGLARWPRRAGRHGTSMIEPERARRPHQAAGGHDARHAFARRLNSALFRALWHDATEAAERLDLEDLIAHKEPAGNHWREGTSAQPSPGRACRTSWLRLMFIAYACPSQTSANS